MNILVVVPWYKPIIGGVVLSIERNYKALAKKGNNIAILINGDYEHMTRVGKDDEIPIYAFNRRVIYSEKKFLKTLVGYLLKLPSTLIRLEKLIKQKHIDLVVLEYPDENDFYFVILKWLGHIKYTVSFHGSDINLLHEGSLVARKSIIWQARNANGVSACSTALMKVIESKIRRLPDKRQVIHNGIDPKWVTASSVGKYSLPEKYILTLAWAVPIKGPDILIKAFAQLIENYPDIYLVMAGSGPMEHELNELIKKLGVEERVKRLGNIPREHLPQIYRQALFGIIPSINEGFGAVSLEFQLFKKAIIASNVGGLPESVIEGFNGHLVPPGDVQALIEKMKYLLDNPAECQRLGENGFNNVISRFQQEMTTECYQQFLNEIVTSR
jgi:L-malate glycosyltransferase